VSVWRPWKAPNRPPITSHICAPGMAWPHDCCSHSVIDPDAGGQPDEHLCTDDDRLWPRDSAGRLRMFVCSCREVTAPVPIADHAFSGEPHQDEPRCRTASIELGTARCRSDGSRPPGPSLPDMIKSRIERSTRSVFAPTPPLASRRPWRVSLRLAAHRGEIHSSCSDAGPTCPQHRRIGSTQTQMPAWSVGRPARSVTRPQRAAPARARPGHRRSTGSRRRCGRPCRHGRRCR
jgi:hypothetical protein